MPISFFSVRNIEDLDFNALVRQFGGGWNPGSPRGRYVRAILESHDMLHRYGINNPNRLAHFIGQGIVETGNLTKTIENLNYSARRLREVWPSRFRSDEIAQSYAGQPERIANYVYGNRIGNGPPESGDGWKYRGRGFFQLTFRGNYREFGRIAGFDLENNPQEIEDVKKSIEVAAAYFQSKNLGPLADADNAVAVSRGVNRGDPDHHEAAHGEADRILWTNRALDLVRDPQALLARASDDPTLRSGAVGERVRALQQDLADLGYPVGRIDSVFGPATRRALINFQEERRLPTTGVVDPATRAALDAALAPPAPVVVTSPDAPMLDTAAPETPIAPPPEVRPPPVVTGPSEPVAPSEPSPPPIEPAAPEPVLAQPAPSDAVAPEPAVQATPEPAGGSNPGSAPSPAPSQPSDQPPSTTQA
ncbi:MAG: peptidoglycan-binding protein [Hyphomonadaceae bacterium]|nr:peptidoglycan-binding protein [Hyphomonadaceae bacterium]